jgi:hypothetical protein
MENVTMPKDPATMSPAETDYEIHTLTHGADFNSPLISVRKVVNDRLSDLYKKKFAAPSDALEGDEKRLTQTLERQGITPEGVREVQEKAEARDAQEAQKKCETHLQMAWGPEWNSNLAAVSDFVTDGLSERSRDLLETPDPKTGIPLGDNGEFIADLFVLMKKYGAVK